MKNIVWNLVVLFVLAGYLFFFTVSAWVAFNDIDEPILKWPIGVLAMCGGLFGILFAPFTFNKLADKLTP